MAGFGFRVLVLVAATSGSSPCARPSVTAQDTTISSAAATCEAVPLSCADGWLTEHRYEDGGCVSSPRASCFPYACADTPTSCRTDCEDDGDCSGGAVCTPGGVCSVIPPVCHPTCQADVERTWVWTDGECALAAVIPCFPYACDGAVCKDHCVTSDDCAAGAVCRDGSACVPEGTWCRDAGTVMDDDGGVISCYPYRCSAGACQDWCVDESDCAEDATCETRNQVCVPPG